MTNEINSTEETTDVVAPAKKKKAPPKKKSLKGTEKKGDGKRAEAWMNMVVPLKKGKGDWRLRKGYPIFNSEQYPDIDGMRLVELAKKNGGEVTVTMQVTIKVNAPADEIDANDIPFM